MEAASPGLLPIRRSRFDRFKQIPPYALLACVLVLAMSPRFVFVKQSEWQQVYVDTSRQFLNGDGLYGPGQPYVYPPFMAAMVTPFSFLSEKVSRAFWLAVNALALVVCLRAGWQLAGGGRRLPGWESSRSEHWILWLGLACGGYYIIDSLGHQQTDLVISALLLRGCLAIREDRSLLAGVLLGIAAACKCTPLLFAPYLIWRGRWLSCVTLLAVAGGVNLIPDLIRAHPDGNLWLMQWWKTFIAPQLRGDLPPGVWASEVIYNQSLSGAFYRWTQTTWTWEALGIVVAPSSTALPAADLRRFVRLAQLGFVLAAAVVFLHRPFRSIIGATTESTHNRHALECSLILILMLLFSPMSSKPHFCTLLLPGLCLARTLMTANNQKVLWCLFATAALCGLLANKDLVKARIYTLVLWYGLVTISAVLLGVGCGLALLQKRKTQIVVPEITEERRAAA